MHRCPPSSPVRSLASRARVHSSTSTNSTSLGPYLQGLGPLDRLRALQADPSVPALWQAHVRGHTETLRAGAAALGPAYAHVVPFLDWCARSRVLVSPFVDIRTAGDAGLGLFARVDVPRNTILASVPLAAALAIPQAPEPQDNFCGAFWRNQDVAALVLLHAAGAAQHPGHGYVQFLAKHPLPANAPFLSDADFGAESPEKAMKMYLSQLLAVCPVLAPALAVVLVLCLARECAACAACA